MPSSLEKNEVDELVEQLSLGEGGDGDALKTDLETIFLRMQTMPQSVLEHITPAAFNIFFKKTSDLKESTESLDLSEKILKRFLELIPTERLFRQFHAELLLGLTKGPTSFQMLILQRMMESVDSEPELSLAELSGGALALFISVLRHISSPELAVSQKASQVLIRVSTHSAGIELLFSNNLVAAEMNNLHKNSSDVVRFRFYELLVGVCTASGEGLQRCVDSGFVGALVSELDDKDVLLKLNALELLADLCEAPGAAEILYKTEVSSKLEPLLQSAQDAPDVGFVLPALIRFFGRLARAHPSDCVRRYPKFVSWLFWLVINARDMDLTLRLTGFDAFALFGSSPEGKLELAKQDSAMKECMKSFGRAIREGAIDVRCRHLEALNLLLALPPEQQTEELLATVEKWFEWMCEGNAADVLFSHYRQPIPEVHFAAGETFATIAQQFWAQKIISQLAGFFEYLLNRETETEMRGRYIKHDIVVRLCESPRVSELFSSPDLLKLREYRDQGVFYFRAQTDIAMEGDA